MHEYIDKHPTGTNYCIVGHVCRLDRTLVQCIRHLWNDFNNNNNKHFFIVWWWRPRWW